MVNRFRFRLPDRGREQPPLVTWIYGGLGLIPFIGGAAAAVWLTSLGRIVAQLELIGYGALILSFLGGGRWGLEVNRRAPVRPLVISASMLPTIAAFLILVAMSVPNPLAPARHVAGLRCAMGVGRALQGHAALVSAAPPSAHPGGCRLYADRRRGQRLDGALHPGFTNPLIPANAGTHITKRLVKGLAPPNSLQRAL